MRCAPLLFNIGLALTMGLATGTGCNRSGKSTSQPASQSPGRSPATRGAPPAAGGTMTIASWDTLLGTVKKLCRLGKLSSAAVEQIVGVPLKQTGDNPYWTMYEGTASAGLLEAVDLRIKNDGSEGLIVLDLGGRADRVALAGSAKSLGKPSGLHVVSPGPGGKPDWEYKYSHVHAIEGQQVALGYEDRNKKTELVYVSIQWKPPGG